MWTMADGWWNVLAPCLLGVVTCASVCSCGGKLLASTVNDASPGAQQDADSIGLEAGADANASDARADAGVDATTDALPDAAVSAPDASDAAPDDAADLADAACGDGCDGACVGGRCIVTLATGQDDPYALAVDDAGVYWTNTGEAADAGSVMRVSKDGGSVMPLETGIETPRFLAVDATRVYWTTPTTVTAWSKSSGTLETLASGQAYPLGIAVDGQNLYWVNDAANGGVMRMALDGGMPTQIASYGGNANQLVISATTAYWNDLAGRRISSVPLTGGTPTLFFNDSNYDVAGIGIDGINLYYTEESYLGPVGKVPLDGGASTILATNNGTFGVVSDGSYVYYTSPNGDAPAYDGAVLRVPVGGGAPTTLATGGGPWGVAIDATSVYWTDTGSGSIMKATPR